MQVSHSLEVLGSQTGIPLDLTKRENSGEDEGLAILEFGGHGGDEHFRISEGKGGGGLKYLCACGRVWIFSGITQ